MSKAVTRGRWISAVLDAARTAGIELPSLTSRAVGDLVMKGASHERFATIKRRFVPLSEATSRGVELTLWKCEPSSPVPVVAIHATLLPSEKEATLIASILNGWLIIQWTDETAISQSRECAALSLAVEQAALDESREFCLSEDRTFRIVVNREHWSIRGGRTVLSSWQSKDSREESAHLPLSSLDAFCRWLAENWTAIAYASDLRPPALRTQPVAASRAFENAALLVGKNTSEREEIEEWWSRHAIRAASGELPNLFFERQADDLIISWDALPTSTRFYRIPAGVEVMSAEFAIPILRQLVASRLNDLRLPESTARFFESDHSEEVAFAIIASYRPEVTRDWLDRHGVTADALAEFSIAGVSRSPVVGLLRSSQGSGLSLEDIDEVASRLAPGKPESYQPMLRLVRGMNAFIDTREPWESGYRLADLVRERFGNSPDDYFEIEAEVRNLGVQLHDLAMSDSGVKAVCIAAPGVQPTVVINSACPDATGESGRRITLAHELCHLLFDRARMRSLARFEGEHNEGDRLIEMRANAFAVQLLAPMSTLTHEDGTVFSNDELADLSVHQHVSLAALSWHARNLRNRSAK